VPITPPVAGQLPDAVGRTGDAEVHEVDRKSCPSRPSSGESRMFESGIHVAVDEVHRVRGIEALAVCRTTSTAACGDIGPRRSSRSATSLAVDQPHVDVQLPVDLAVVVDGDDVGRPELRGDLRLAAEPAAG
jgi:hypothetical protein